MKVGILFSDTGGGHRAASNAIKAALEELQPGIKVQMRDGLVEGGTWPLNRSPSIYAWGMKWARWAWALFFHLWNGPIRARFMADIGYPATKKRLKQLLVDMDADVYISTHPLLTRSVARTLKDIPGHRPFGIVVTDLVTGHWSWYDKGADRIFVPTEEAFQIVKKGGVDPSKLTLTGQAVHPRCGDAVPQREDLRSRFGWTEPTVLLVGGGDGMGGLGRYAKALDQARGSHHFRVVVVCGRNAALKAELDSIQWKGATEIFGFVQNLHELMAASDILVTKGGPGSIMEGCVAGLPILLYDYLPGQEVGNVRLIKDRRIGLYVPKPKDLAQAVLHWLANPQEREATARRSREYSTPDSATRIAKGVLEMADEAQAG